MSVWKDGTSFRGLEDGLPGPRFLANGATFEEPAAAPSTEPEARVRKRAWRREDPAGHAFHPPNNRAREKLFGGQSRRFPKQSHKRRAARKKARSRSETGKRGWGCFYGIGSEMGHGGGIYGESVKGGVLIRSPFSLFFFSSVHNPHFRSIGVFPDAPCRWWTSRSGTPARRCASRVSYPNVKAPKFSYFRIDLALNPPVFPPIFWRA